MRKALAILGVLFGLWALEAPAATFTVSNTADSGAGSLRQAILDSEASPGADEITFGSVSGKITLASILPTVTDELTISGPGAATLTISGNRATQLFSITASAKINISALTISEGRTEPYLNGGAILNRGKLTLTACTLENNHAHGGFGGAVYNEGELTVFDCRLSNNDVTGGASAGSGENGALGGGGGGFGGAIYSRLGSLSITDSILSQNLAAGGSGNIPFTAGGSRYTPGQGGGSAGGGIQPAGFGSGGGGGVTEGGTGGFGGGGGGAGGSDRSVPPGPLGGLGGYGGGRGGTPSSAANVGQYGGGGAGFGGAVFIESGEGTILGSQFLENTATGGSTGGGIWFGPPPGPNAAPTPGAGMGGAVFINEGHCLIEASDFASNAATVGFAPTEYATGMVGQGGAIMIYAGSLEIRATSLRANRAGGYGDGHGGGFAGVGGLAKLANTTLSGNSVFSGAIDRNGSGGVARGGGTYAAGCALSLINCTVASNWAIAGRYGQYDGAPGARHAGGLFAAEPNPTILNTLFAGNQVGVMSNSYEPIPEAASDVEGTISSLGHNLLETSTGVQGSVATDKLDIAALIEPLADTGGLTPTHALLPGSPAIDGGTLVGAPDTDQRGELRPQGPAVDIGAHEQSALTLKINGRIVLRGAVTQDISVTLSLQPTQPAGAIVYTLDGSAPDLGSTPYSQPVTLTQSARIRAAAYSPGFSTFVPAGPVDLTIIPGHNLALTKSGQGTVSADPPQGPYVQGSNVTVRAEPDAGWKFQGWSGDLTGNASPVTITMDRDKSIQATFVLIPDYSLTVTTSGEGTLSVSPSPGPYREGTTVTVSANPAEGWLFEGWSGNASGSENPLTLTMDENKVIQANFRRIVSFSASTRGGGTIEVTPSTPPYFAGQTVVARATPAAGWQFLGWHGDAAITDPSIQLVLDGDTSIEAVFGTTIGLESVGGGSILAQPSSTIYPYGTAIRLTGIPSPGQRFSFWGSPINSDSNPVDYQVTQANATVSAVFVPLGEEEAALTVFVEGSGNVSTSPSGNHFALGTSVTLTAAHPSAFEFVGWSGDASGSENPLTIAMDTSKVINAKFIALPQTSVIYQTSGEVPGEPAGTTFASFGTPAINELGQMAFTTTILENGAKTAALYAGSRIIARKSAAAPDESGTPHGLYFADLLDPVLDDKGHVAFKAKVTDVFGDDPRLGIWTDADGALKLIALENGEAAGVPGSRWAKFKSISLQSGQVLISATLKKGGGVKDGNDQGVWTWTAAEGMKLQLREGTTSIATISSAKTIKSIAIFPSIAGSLAQGRTHAMRAGGGRALAARVTFTDKTQGILGDDGAGSFRLTAQATSGMPVTTYSADPALAGVLWDSFNFPGWSMDGSRLGFLARIKSAAGKISGNSAIFVDRADGRLDLAVREGDPVPDPSASPEAGATFKSFKDPVIGGSLVEYAFVGKVAGAQVKSGNDSGLWMGTSEGLRLVAREGEGSDVLPAEARWKSFQSLALGSSRGPLFVADLETRTGGVTKTTKRGLWGMDSTGLLWPLIRQGDFFETGGRTVQVQGFTALTPAIGAEGTTRGLSASGGQIVVTVELSDGTQALVKIEIP